MSAAGRNIFAVLAQRSRSIASDPEKAQDAQQERYVASPSRFHVHWVVRGTPGVLRDPGTTGWIAREERGRVN